MTPAGPGGRLDIRITLPAKYPAVAVHLKLSSPAISAAALEHLREWTGSQVSPGPPFMVAGALADLLACLALTYHTAVDVSSEVTLIDICAGYSFRTYKANLTSSRFWTRFSILPSAVFRSST